VDGNGDAEFHFFNEAHNVPICESNAAVTGGTSDRIGNASAVQADAFFAKLNPYDADRIVGPGLEHVVFVAAFATIQHGFVPAEIGQFRDAFHFPVANRRLGAFRPDSDGICGNELFVLKDGEHVRLGINFHRIDDGFRSWLRLFIGLFGFFFVAFFFFGGPFGDGFLHRREVKRLHVGDIENVARFDGFRLSRVQFR
jgi:hypothetical protein